MTKTHDIKIEKQHADAKLAGDKNFEVRFNDRDYQVGDYLRYKVVLVYPDGSVFNVMHPLNKQVREVTYITDYEQKDGFVVFGDKEVKE